MGEELSTEEKNGRVEDLLQLFGLLEHAESIVGGVHYKGLSGGQIKRLSIAVECIHKPALVYLDEPTTGLDAVVSLDLMNSIRNLADCGRTILCTIHQPSSLMCSMFDKIFLMADGQPIFCGPYDQAVPYFRDSVHAFPFATGRYSTLTFTLITTINSNPFSCPNSNLYPFPYFYTTYDPFLLFVIGIYSGTHSTI